MTLFEWTVIAAAAAATLAGGRILYWQATRARRGDASDFFMWVVRHRLGYLRLPREGLREFSREFQRRNLPPDRRRSWIWLGAAGPLIPLIDRWLRGGARRAVYVPLSDALLSTYLMSTDFFHHGADESRRLRYRGYYDAMSGRCDNPFADLRMDDAARRGARSEVPVAQSGLAAGQEGGDR